ncbi:MAG: DEAD/DEAH box helicase family protein [Bacilli bacterium]|nr:DEAD/DEAH box helicase family protein [Bacilli bacterium]
MELTKIQKEAVDNIFSYYSNSEKVRVDFKSPTGSGKTLMASYLISLIIEANPDKKFVFVIATPSSSKLPFFFEQKINKYKKDLPYSKFEVEYIESPSSKASSSTVEETPKIKIVDNKVYIFGKATFGSKRIFSEQHVIDDFVDEVKTQGYKLIYIRDEAHIGDLKTDNESKQFEVLMQSNADFILKMTATPNLSDSSVKIVTVKESDLCDPLRNENKWLLKTTAKTLLQSSMTEEAILEDAINEFKRIKSDYKKLEENGVFIHPALLIQASNEPSKKDEKEEFLKQIKLIKDKLDFHGLAWVQYFGDSDKDSNRVYKDNFSLDDITQTDNEIDVILFKVGPATGWDIPRACMLLQLRKVCSEKLNTQTIGRIKRNPYPGLVKNSITDVYYIYSNSPQDASDFSYFNYKLRKQAESVLFPSIEIHNRAEFKLSTEKDKLQKAIKDYIVNSKNDLIQEIKNIFVFENGIDVFKNELYEVGGSMVYSSVISPFVFLKLLQRLIDSKNDIFKLCNQPLKDAFDSDFKKELLYDEKPLQLEHLQFVVLHNHTKDLQDIIKKWSPFTPSYKVAMMTYIPQQFIEIYDMVASEGNIDSSDNTYMFDVVKNNSSANIQPLDSGSERIVFDLLKNYIQAINEFMDNKIELWCKNYASSSVNADYIDGNHSFHKSYFDFIIKFANGAFLYIEVKNKTDIDEDKTKLLKQSYKDYFDSKMVNVYDVPIVLSVWTVQGSMVYTDTFYDHKLFKTKLDTLTAKDLIKAIALETF